MRRRFAVLCLLGLAACDTSSITTLPPTQVLVRIRASDEVRSATRQLRVHASVQERRDASWVDRPPITIDTSTGASTPASASGASLWPIDIPVLPRDPEALPQLFQIVAEALDENGSVLVEQRAITAFVQHAQLMLQMTLERCGEQPLGVLCASDPACQGSGCQSCRSGRCADTPVIGPAELAPLQPGAPADAPREPNAASRDAGAGGDAPRQPIDGAAPANDAGVGRDAGGEGQAGAAVTDTAIDAGGAAGASGATSTEPGDRTPALTWSRPEFLETGDKGVFSAAVSGNKAGDMVVAWWQSEDDGYLFARRYVDSAWESDTFVVRDTETQPADNERDILGLGIDSSGSGQIFFRGLAEGPANSDGSKDFQGYWVPWTGSGSRALSQPPLVLGDQKYARPTLLSVRENGTAIAAWGGEAATTWGSTAEMFPIYYNSLGPNGWGTPSRIGECPNASYYSAIVGDDQGGTAVIFLHSGSQDMLAPPYTLRTFIIRGSVVSSVEPLVIDEPSVWLGRSMMDTAGNIMLFVSLASDAQSWSTHWLRYSAAENRWSAPARLTESYELGCALTQPTGLEAVAVCTEVAQGSKTGYVSFRVYSEASGWTTAERLSEDVDFMDSEIGVTGSPDGGLFATWRQAITLSDGSSATAIAYNHSTVEGGWSGGGVVTTYTGNAQLAALNFDSKGHALVVWYHQPFAGSPWDLRWIRSE